MNVTGLFRHCRLMISETGAQPAFSFDRVRLHFLDRFAIGLAAVVEINSIS